MDQNKIDRLFREKMDNLEVMPSAGAWSQVEKQIRPKNSFKVYWVAAAIVLIFGSWLFWPSQTEVNQTPIASAISYPPLLDVSEFAFTEIKVIEEKMETSKNKQVARKSKTQFVAKDTESSSQVPPLAEEIAPLEMEAKNAVAVAEINQPDVIEYLTANSSISDFSAVKITYIASTKNQISEELQKTDSANGFKKFIAFAEKIDPGEIMAEFKSAKDNLLNNGFKKKEKNSL